MNKYEEMIQKFAADLELETESPEKYSISKLIRSGSESILRDIENLSELAFLIRTGKVKVVDNVEE